MPSDAVLYVALVAAPAAGILGCLAGGCLMFRVMCDRRGAPAAGDPAAQPELQPVGERVKAPPPRRPGTTAPIQTPPDAEPKAGRRPPALRA